MAAAAFLLIFGCVYESFSHEVYSPWMVFAFCIPLMLGLVPLLAFTALFHRAPDGWAMMLWNWALCTWTAGSLLFGALAIYGITNRLLAIYPVAGAVLALLAVGAELWNMR